ncbi:MAG: 4-hydroxy-3-methylbut-2-enyl diphosphate reductase [Lachnospiraceae bacterium]|nr:4-hydroxy-3-methylbut-2-enyl diphosphate reductase [Lachnospiraceae bacterium]
MEILVAKNAGFCFGVKRAVETVYRELSSGDAIYTYGPIIHNEEVVGDLLRRGVKIIEGIDELKKLGKENCTKKSTKPPCVIIRSHGASREVHDIIKNNGLRLVDATCPFVAKIQKTVEEESRKGRTIIIIGNARHPEVEGITGWSHSAPIVVETREEAESVDLSRDTPVSVVAQTTFNFNKFQELVEIFLNNWYDISTVNTICNATETRQTEALRMARDVDVMLVAGGAKSSNTQKLYEICSRECKYTYFIQTAEDLKDMDFSKVGRLGVTAGASTPNNIIEEILNYVRANI